MRPEKVLNKEGWIRIDHNPERFGYINTKYVEGVFTDEEVESIIVMVSGLEVESPLPVDETWERVVSGIHIYKEVETVVEV